MPSPARVLAFDPASVTGWAFHDGDEWQCGSIDLVFPEFRRVVMDADKNPRLGTSELRCVCENPAFNTGDQRKVHFAMAYIELAYGYISNTRVEYVALAKWRAFYCIKSNRPKGQRTAHLKDQAIEIALKLGAMVPKDDKGNYMDDPAEAVCLAEFVMRRDWKERE